MDVKCDIITYKLNKVTSETKLPYVFFHGRATYIIIFNSI